MAADETQDSTPSAPERCRATPALRDAVRFAVVWVGPWVRSAPGTHVWLLILAVNSAILAVAPPELGSFLLRHTSTNLMELGAHPVRALIVSALWIESPSGFALCFVLYELVHAPAERRLGTARWLGVVGAAHIGATLISQQAVLLGISSNQLPGSLAHTVDVGVSYGLAGILGVLTSCVPHRPWPLRPLYAAGVLGCSAYPLLSSGRAFTDLGHFSSVLIGLACLPLMPKGRALRAPRRLRPRRWRR